MGYSTIQDSFFISGNCLRELIYSVMDKGALFRFCARGNSMSPFIKDGDILTLAPIGYQKIGMGNIVAFVHGDTLTLRVHRIIGKGTASYYVKGDNLQSADGMISSQNILARVIAIEHGSKVMRFSLGYERYLIAFLQRLGFFLPVAVALRWLTHQLRMIHATPATKIR